MSSVVLAKPARFRASYTRLFKMIERKVYWTNRSGDQQQRQFCMDAVTGCPDSALFAFSEIAALACHKADEAQNGRVHDADLTSRSDVIRCSLRLWTPQSDSTIGAAQDRHKLSVAKIWNEAAGIYLDATLSDFNTGMLSPSRATMLIHCIARFIPHCSACAGDCGRVPDFTPV